MIAAEQAQQLCHQVWGIIDMDDSLELTKIWG
jgi:hypothetical protein